MSYLRLEKNPSGAYPAPQGTYATGLVSIDGEELKTFLAYSGFVNVTINGDEVVGVEPDMEAWATWKETKVEPVEEPSAQDDTDSMLVDHEYRITLLELGITE